MTARERISWIHRLEHRPGLTRFRVLPENPADERDRVLGMVRRRLWARYFRGEVISRDEAERLLELLDEWYDRLPLRQVRRPAEFTTDLVTRPSRDLGRLADFTGSR